MTAITTENYSFLQRYIREASGNVIDAGKEYLLEARLNPILHQQSIQTINDLCSLLKSTAPAELRRLVVEAMTTHETLFFRDIAFFESLRRTVLPELAQRRGGKLRVWSAAASSGQEAYSIAMLALEAGLLPENIEIVGTDISHQILDRARQGSYLQLEVNRGLPAALLVKYFTRNGLQWQVRPEVRKLCSFHQCDLRRPMPVTGKFDLVLCRNVLIYFDLEIRKEIVKRMVAVMDKHSLLVFGAAENALSLDLPLRRRVIENGVYYEVNR